LTEQEFTIAAKAQGVRDYFLGEAIAAYNELKNGKPSLELDGDFVKWALEAQGIRDRKAIISELFLFI